MMKHGTESGSDDQWEPWGSLTMAPQTGTAAADGRILIVDDEPMIRRILARILQRHGYGVATAENGSEALKMLDRTRFDLVISDISMPGCDGLSLMDAMRRRHIDLPVLLVTGVPTTESAIQAVRLGAVGYLGKPLESRGLLSEVERALRLNAIAKLRRQAVRMMRNEHHGADNEHASLHRQLDRAIDALFMMYQPIVSWSDKRVVGYEALVRSSEPTLSGPDQLFHTAEALGRVEELGRGIRSRCVEPFDADRDSTLFINLHAQDLADDALCSDDNPLVSMADRVVLEVTERAQLEELRNTETHIARLRDMGFRIAIDDIGAGYAGLSSFALLEPDLIKLDKSLVRGVESAPLKHKLIRSLTSLCQDLGIAVIAEGVETMAERDSLLELGCDLFQGYLFCRPALGIGPDSVPPPSTLEH